MNPDYDVVVWVQIHSSFSGASTEDKYVKKHLSLPFPPFVGLEICSGDGNFNVVLQSVAWRLSSHRFECYGPDDKEIYNGLLRHQTYRPIEEIVQEYVDNGWERDE